MKLFSAVIVLLSSVKAFEALTLNVDRGDFIPRKSTFNTYEPPKFCVECKHFVPHKSDTRFGKCNAFPIERTSFFLITKEIDLSDVDFRLCSTARNMEHLCGFRAKCFVPMDDDKQ